MNRPDTTQPVTPKAAQVVPRTLGTGGLLILAIGTFALGVDGFVLSGLLPLGFSAGLTIVPQQHRLFAAVPKLAPVAVGLNGSGIYIATALGAAAGGTALAAAGSTALPVTAAAIGMLAVIVAVTAVRQA